MYAPKTDYAYREMQKDLLRLLKKAGNVKVTQKYKDALGETHRFEYRVREGFLIKKTKAIVHYRWGQDPVVIVKKGTVTGLDEFIRTFHSRFKRKEKRYR